MNIQPSKSDTEKLVELKMPLVLRDYQSYFEASTRELEKSAKLQHWELTVAFGITAITMKTGSFGMQALLGSIFVVLLFWVLESRAVINEWAIFEIVILAEEKLQESDLSKFQLNIQDWEFGNHAVRKWHPGIKKMMELTFYQMCSFRRILFHGSIIVCNLFLFFMPHSRIFKILSGLKLGPDFILVGSVVAFSALLLASFAFHKKNQDPKERTPNEKLMHPATRKPSK